jgi:hypothetical protein
MDQKGGSERDRFLSILEKNRNLGEARRGDQEAKIGRIPLRPSPDHPISASRDCLRDRESSHIQFGKIGASLEGPNSRTGKVFEPLFDYSFSKKAQAKLGKSHPFANPLFSLVLLSLLQKEEKAWKKPITPLRTSRRSPG